MNAQLQYQIEQFFYRKSELCDAQDWDAYVQLFDEQSEFHLPQWDSEHVYTRDPKREMSLIYYPNRSGLEDRVFRLRTGKSASSTPPCATASIFPWIAARRLRHLSGAL